MSTGEGTTHRVGFPMAHRKGTTHRVAPTFVFYPVGALRFRYIFIGGFMTLDRSVHHRHSVRLYDYDYSGPGAYFITICTLDRICLFGRVVNCDMVLSDIGDLVRQEWVNTESIRPYVTVDRFVVMPDHTHAIVVINAVQDSDTAATGEKGRADNGLMSGGVGEIVGQFKSVVTKRINRLRNSPGASVWQRNYYERIIRDERELNMVRQYIEQNPVRWGEKHTGLQ